jgi:hypothetical protein
MDPQHCILNFEVLALLDVLVLRAEGFSCSWDVLYSGLGISKLQFLIKNIKFFSSNFFQFFFIKTPDPEPDPDSH